MVDNRGVPYLIQPVGMEVCHVKLHNVILSTCHQAHISATLETGSSLTPGMDHTRSADVLVRDWALGKLAAI